MEAWQCGFVVQVLKECGCKLYLRSQLLAIPRKLAQLLSCCACALSQPDVMVSVGLQCLFVLLHGKPLSVV